MQENRATRRAKKSKKKAQYRGLARPTSNGIANSKRKTGKAGY